MIPQNPEEAMTEHIKIREPKGTWTVRAKGAVLAESSNVLELTEGDYPSVIYFPRDDVGMAFLEETDSSTVCPHKGAATYYAFHGKSGIVPDVAWSYETPLDAMAAITGYLAFFGGKVTIEEL
jgi:uncharacterized protein (DUF427 family)